MGNYKQAEIIIKESDGQREGQEMSLEQQAGF